MGLLRAACEPQPLLTCNMICRKLALLAWSAGQYVPDPAIASCEFPSKWMAWSLDDFGQRVLTGLDWEHATEIHHYATKCVSEDGWMVSVDVWIDRDMARLAATRSWSAERRVYPEPVVLRWLGEYVTMAVRDIVRTI